MDKPPCRASTIRSDGRFDMGSGGTGGRELGDKEVFCRMARLVLMVPERARPRTWLPPSGLSMACSTDSFTEEPAPNTSSYSALCVLLTLLKNSMLVKAITLLVNPYLELGIRSLTGVRCCFEARYRCASMTGGKISK